MKANSTELLVKNLRRLTTNLEYIFMKPENQQPMSLEDLPAYLKQMQESGKTGSVLVNTGQIISKNKRSSFEKSIFFMVIFTTLILGAMITYSITSTKQLTITIDVQNNVESQEIQQMVSESGGKVISIEKNADSTYEVTMETKKSRRSILDWWSKSKDVKKAKLED